MTYVYSLYTIAFLLPGKPNCSFELFRSKKLKVPTRLKNYMIPWRTIGVGYDLPGYLCPFPHFEGCQS